ncbi:MAG: hypothetical protein PHT66_02450, partial [Candidatus Pacebacteria bacterium]|nr:hypothetical protein [Candidatus Paceibacterota bacterium]
MKINNNLTFLIIILAILAISLIGFSYLKTGINEEGISKEKVKGIMLLIEYKDTVGLANFVNEMKERDIKGLLMVTPEFVQDNCEEIKEVIKHDIELVASNIGAPLWDIPYEEQKARIIE